MWLSSSSAVIYNLKTKPKFNGALGCAVEFVENKQRYHFTVQCESQIFNILVKKQNLIFVKNMHELIEAKNMTYDQLPWLAKATKINQSKQDIHINDDEKEMIMPSDIVLIHHLKSKKQWNNLFAKIVQYNDKSNRYHITFEFENKMYQKALKGSNLKLVFPSKYSKNDAVKCVVCSQSISSSQQILICQGCASLNYCSIQCRNKHHFIEGHHGQSCYIYRRNILHNVLNFKYILRHEITSPENIMAQETQSYITYLKSNSYKTTSVKTKVNCWEDWMTHFGFNHEASLYHTYPMTFYYILKQFVPNLLNNNQIDIHLVGCSDSEFMGIETLRMETDNNPLNQSMFKTMLKMYKLFDKANVGANIPLNKDLMDCWKWRWKLMAQLLDPIKINITCYGNQMSPQCTDCIAQTLTITFKQWLYIPCKMKQKPPDIVIGLHAGIHEHQETWLPVLRYCVENKIPMMFTEAEMVEYELYIRHLFSLLGVEENTVVGFNPFRDTVPTMSPFMRRINAVNTFLYGVTQYD